MNTPNTALPPTPSPGWLNRQFKTFGSLARWLFSRRTVQRFLFGVACLATLIALFYAEENWRGKRAWMQFKRACEAKGEQFDVAALVPKPVPDDQNFAMTPLLAPLLDYAMVMQPSDPKDPVPRVYRTIQWRDTNAQQQAQGIQLAANNRFQAMPRLGFWLLGLRVDLAGWQAYFRSNSVYALPSQPQSPPADVLSALGRFEGALAELRAASRRPYAQFKVHYEDGIYAFLPHWSVLRNFSQILRLRIAAELALGQTDAALADLRLGFCLVNSLQRGLLTLSHYLRLDMVDDVCQVIWEGLADHRWSDAQLIEIQAQLRSLNLLSDLSEALRGERALGCYSLEQLRRSRQLQILATMNEREWNELADKGYDVILRHMPSGWWYRNELYYARCFPEWAFHLKDGAGQRFDFTNAQQEEKNWGQVWRDLRAWSPTNQFRPFCIAGALLALQSGRVGVVETTALRRTAVDEAAVACALERYRLVHQKFPDALEALVPRFLNALPPDLFTGTPLQYRLESNGQFVLYSVGWNEADEGGMVAIIKGSRGEPYWQKDQGDWVWQYP
jgi:hypothetical protein